MTEYQCYEFQTVDRALTIAEQKSLRHLSSRARISPASFINHYDYGDFGGNPHELVDELFDAHLYLAKWGTRCLLFRLPLGLVDEDTYLDYCDGECVSLRTTATHAVLAIERYEDPPDGDWDDGTEWLASLMPLRDALQDGDLRCIYLAWLLGVQSGAVDAEDDEPPVPPGLGDLTTPLRALVEFMQIDEGLVEVATSASADRVYGLPSEGETAAMVAAMCTVEKDLWLTRLLGEHNPHLCRELRRALQIRGPQPERSSPGVATPGRTAGELMDCAFKIPTRGRRVRC